MYMKNSYYENIVYFLHNLLLINFLELIIFT